MREIYLPKHFKLQELVDRQTFEKLGSASIWLLDINMLKFLDGVREYFNSPMTVNNWASGGSFQSRGYRSMFDKTGASYSQHRCGRAFDFDVAGRSADEVRKIILDNQNVFPFSLITTLEIDVSWIHADNRLTNELQIKLIKP